MNAHFNFKFAVGAIVMAMVLIGLVWAAGFANPVSGAQGNSATQITAALGDAESNASSFIAARPKTPTPKPCVRGKTCPMP
jgi:hypothetical protein